MHPIPRPDKLHVHNDRASDNQIRCVYSDSNPVMDDRGRDLLFHKQRSLMNLVHRGIFINLLQKPRAQRIGNRTCTANDTLRNFVPIKNIRVHLWLKNV